MEEGKAGGNAQRRIKPSNIDKFYKMGKYKGQTFILENQWNKELAPLFVQSAASDRNGLPRRAIIEKYRRSH
jgi:hypothetical protein